MSKYNVPLALLSAIEPLASQNADIIEHISSKKYIYNFTAGDGELYFRIHKEKTNSGYFLFELKPSSANNEQGSEISGGIQGIVNAFQSWIKLAKDLIAFESVLDDPFIKKYTEHYFSEFEVIDDPDAFIHPFTPIEQAELETCLDKTIFYLENNNFPKEVVDEIANEIKTLKNEMPKLTKAKVMLRISKVLAKIYSESTSVATGIYNGVKTVVIKEGTNLIVRGGSNLIDLFTN